jgi:hypothetical protein
MSSSRRSGCSKADASKDAPVPASPEKIDKGKKRKQALNEAEAAANDAAKEIADMANGTDRLPHVCLMGSCSADSKNQTLQSNSFRRRKRIWQRRWRR